MLARHVNQHLDCFARRCDARLISHESDVSFICSHGERATLRGGAAQCDDKFHSIIDDLLKLLCVSYFQISLLMYVIIIYLCMLYYIIFKWIGFSKNISCVLWAIVYHWVVWLTPCCPSSFQIQVSTQVQLPQLRRTQVSISWWALHLGVRARVWVHFYLCYSCSSTLQVGSLFYVINYGLCFAYWVYVFWSFKDLSTFMFQYLRFIIWDFMEFMLRLNTQFIYFSYFICKILCYKVTTRFS